MCCIDWLNTVELSSLSNCFTLTLNVLHKLQTAPAGYVTPMFALLSVRVLNAHLNTSQIQAACHYSKTMCCISAPCLIQFSSPPPRERLTSGLRRYRALCHMTESHQAPRHVTCESQETEAPTNSNNTWYAAW